MSGGRPGRLRKGTEFDTAYEKGTTSSGPLFVVRVLANGRDDLRVGLAVGKRLLPKAHDRNRVRRRLREAVVRGELSPGYDVIVTAKARAVTASFAELVTGIRNGFDSARRRSPV